MDIMKRVSFSLFFVFLVHFVSGQVLSVSGRGTKNDFSLSGPDSNCVILVDSMDADVVKIAANLFSEDVNRVTGIKPAVCFNLPKSTENVVIIGSMEKSQFIGKLMKKGKISVQNIQGQWERYNIKTVSDPFPGIKHALVIAGSDRRGAAFGVFEISRAIGVSPWYWWADVPARRMSSIFIKPVDYTSDSPSVKYRGIFLNDEDWGLQPWAAHMMDKDSKDIGPNTYAKIFELLLRLKANFIWPAMHDCTKAFYYYPGNPVTADKYAIVVGSSHCEPILRNNVFEWAENYEHEYGKKPGEWRYDINKDEIYKYWDDRAKQSRNYESVYTVGMRGIHDGSMPGPKSRDEKLKLLQQVITDQRNLLSQDLNKDINKIPQIFCPYKEVLQLYQAGLQLPDDVTIVWADDNHGYIRQLSNPQEQRRSGASGIYYHLSYWGAPHDYLWLSSVSPSLASYELSKAYALGASNLWVINVGDIKPAEAEVQFTMDLAYDIHQWGPENASQYTQKWASEIFGEKFAKQIADIKKEYYRLAECAKPEHMGILLFDDTTAEERLNDYAKITKKAEMLKSQIPAEFQDAYFQLVYYPVMGADLMNEKIIYSRKSLDLAAKGDSLALAYSGKAEAAFAKIKELTEIYNQKISGGKWQRMMSWKPRNLEVFNMPKVATAAMIGQVWVKDTVKGTKKQVEKVQGASASEKVSRSGKVILSAADIVATHPSNGQTIKVMDGLGIGGKGITIMPYDWAPVDESSLSKASSIEFKTKLTKGEKSVNILCLPTRSYYPGRKLRYAISVNNGAPQIVNMDIPQEDRKWEEAVLRGFSLGHTIHQLSTNGEASIRIYFLDPGLVINRIEVK